MKTVMFIIYDHGGDNGGDNGGGWGDEDHAADALLIYIYRERDMYTFSLCS